MRRRWHAALVYLGLLEDPARKDRPPTRADIIAGVIGAVVAIAVLAAVGRLLGFHVDLLGIVAVVAAVTAVFFARRRDGGRGGS
jgi:Mn2+/Fe2+ NRAMP family transporter